MDSRQWCTLVVRGLGLWFFVDSFPTVIGGVLQAIKLATGDGSPGIDGWYLAGYLGPLLVVLLGGWLFLDGKEVIDHFQFVTGRCPRCGYDLIKVKGDACPECGLERQRRDPGPSSDDGKS